MDQTTGSIRVKRHLRREDDSMNPTINHAVEETGFVQRRYAGFWMRFWAFLFDLLILTGINGVLVNTWAPFIASSDSRWSFFFTAFFVPSVLYAILFFLYFGLMTRFFRQTLGKMIFGIEVISAKGDRLTWGQLFFREGVGRFLHQAPILGNLTLLAYIVVACTPKKQGVHDLFAETYVVHVDETS
ncbi:RDD family protein [Shouchella sp. 1P09AA]|uniref:RDD family protein n=1 Tax=unclassified Shouchella TaxID=2893065 RepID=UPI0039A01AAC